MSLTPIQWTDYVWNPTRGCSRVSEGCRKCYAERDAARNRPGSRSPTTGEPFAIFKDSDGRKEAHWTGKVELIESKLTEPLHWKKPRRVFVNSMSDLFHEELTNEQIACVFLIMAMSQQHDYQVLTKRAQRLPVWTKWFQEWVGRPSNILAQCGALQLSQTQAAELFHALTNLPLPNVWLGVSVEDRANKYRIDLLRQTPAAVRFLSIEPLLEDIGALDLTGIHWVIVGGESGPGARPCDLAWIESIADQCGAASVPLFVKQTGARPGYQRKHGWHDISLSDSKGGNPEEWPKKIRIREFPR